MPVHVPGFFVFPGRPADYEGENGILWTLW